MSHAIEALSPSRPVQFCVRGLRNNLQRCTEVSWWFCRFIFLFQSSILRRFFCAIVSLQFSFGARLLLVLPCKSPTPVGIKHEKMSPHPVLKFPTWVRCDKALHLSCDLDPKTRTEFGRKGFEVFEGFQRGSVPRTRTLNFPTFRESTIPWQCHLRVHVSLLPHKIYTAREGPCPNSRARL